MNQRLAQINFHLTLQRWRTFKLLLLLRTEEFKFPMSSASL